MRNKKTNEKNKKLSLIGKKVFWKGKDTDSYLLFSSSINENNFIAIKYLINNKHIFAKQLYNNKYLLEIALNSKTIEEKILNFLINETGVEFILKNIQIVETIAKSKYMKIFRELIDNDISLESNINNKTLISYLMDKNFFVFKRITTIYKDKLKLDLSDKKTNILTYYLLNKKEISIDNIKYIITLSNKKEDFKDETILHKIIEGKKYLETISDEIIFFLINTFNFNFNFQDEFGNTVFHKLLSSNYNTNIKFKLFNILKEKSLLLNVSLFNQNKKSLIHYLNEHLDKKDIIDFISNKTNFKEKHLIELVGYNYSTNNFKNVSLLFENFHNKYDFINILNLYINFSLKPSSKKEYKKIFNNILKINKNFTKKSFFNIISNNFNEENIFSDLFIEFVKNSDVSTRKTVLLFLKQRLDLYDDIKISNIYSFKYRTEYNKMIKTKFLYKKVNISKDYDNYFYLKTSIDYLKKIGTIE